VNRGGESKAQGRRAWRFREMGICSVNILSVARQCLQVIARRRPKTAITISCNHNNSVTSRFNITGDLSIQTNRGK